MSLKCEKCGHEPDSLTCPDCGEAAHRWARFCPHCGLGLPAETAAAEEIPTDRRLCPDGDCIGILNAKGRCVICGRAG